MQDGHPPVSLLSRCKPLLVLPYQPDIRPRATPNRRLALMFRPVKHAHFAADRLGRNEVRLLGHVSRPVDFAIVADSLLDADLGGCFLIRAEFYSVRLARLGQSG